LSIEVKEKDLGTTPKKKPSKELIDLIKNCVKNVNNLHATVERIKEKGRAEGFTDYEILDLVRTHLKGVLTYRQIKWLVIEKEQLTIKRQLEVKQTQEQGSQNQSKTKTITSENKPVRLEQQEIESIPDMKATIDTQAQYIDTLENKLEEKKEIAEAQGIKRVKVSVSQLYRECLLMRSSNAIYTNILIDSNNNKFVRLEPL
jgi:regulator of replication initiation timing